MKKLMTLFIVFIMLWVCSPSSGLLLIYRVSTSVRGVDDTTGLTVKVPFKAYLILDLPNSIR